MFLLGEQLLVEVSKLEGEGEDEQLSIGVSRLGGADGPELELEVLGLELEVESPS